jgi:hypothetical protein
LPAKEQWGAVLAHLKSDALQKVLPEVIAQYLRDKRKELMGLAPPATW